MEKQIQSFQDALVAGLRTTPGDSWGARGDSAGWPPGPPGRGRWGRLRAGLGQASCLARCEEMGRSPVESLRTTAPASSPRAGPSRESVTQRRGRPSREFRFSGQSSLSGLHACHAPALRPRAHSASVLRNDHPQLGAGQRACALTLTGVPLVGAGLGWALAERRTRPVPRVVTWGTGTKRRRLLGTVRLVADHRRTGSPLRSGR